MTGAHQSPRAEDPAPALRSDDPAMIRAEISETRERISHELDEIGERLNPQHVKAQIKDGVREATIGRVEDMARQAGEGFMQTIKDNPLPAAMAGVGLAWLYMNRSAGQSYRTTGSSRYSREARQSGYNQSYADSYRYESEQNRLSEVADTVKEKLGDVTGKAQEVVSGATNTGTMQARRLEDTFFENPIAIGIAIVAAGLALGLAAPETGAERKLMGEAGSQLREKVGEAARETTEKLSTVAERALEETKTAAREEGLTGDPPAAQTPLYP